MSVSVSECQLSVTVSECQWVSVVSECQLSVSVSECQWVVSEMSVSVSDWAVSIRMQVRLVKLPSRPRPACWYKSSSSWPRNPIEKHQQIYDIFALSTNCLFATKPSVTLSPKTCLMHFRICSCFHVSTVSTICLCPKPFCCLARKHLLILTLGCKCFKTLVLLFWGHTKSEGCWRYHPRQFFGFSAKFRDF